MELDAAEVSIVTNAIAFALYAGDGREVKKIMGVETIDATHEETAKAKEAARRALTQLTEHRALNPLLTEQEREALATTGRLANMVHALINEGGTGVMAENDWTEAALHIHVIQQMIMGQAAARAYPNFCRKLGARI